MSEETPAAGTPEQQQQAQLLLDDRDMRVSYVNGYFFHPSLTNDEVVMDVGFNVPRPNPQQGGQLQVWFKVSDRMVMSYPTAKRLANSLIQAVKRYEQQFGEIRR